MSLRALLAPILLALALGGAPAAQTAPSPVNVLAGNRLAIHGYDPVAYFVEGRPRRGRPEFAVEHRGARWLFANEENRGRFRADPERYLPAYGGYCAYGVSQGYLVKIDPNAWRIVDGRLYLNYDRGVQRTWEKDVPGHVATANRNWPRLVPAP
ncbi:MAG TPA: YHS domain-containing (seleno)protein [Beijerinckiaceae bacterium]|nr:YHS domain-containing (seleno)protein [Beijerinckiaceae bacterium]